MSNRHMPTGVTARSRAIRLLKEVIERLPPHERHALAEVRLMAKGSHTDHGQMALAIVHTLAFGSPTLRLPDQPDRAEALVRRLLKDGEVDRAVPMPV